MKLIGDLLAHNKSLKKVVFRGCKGINLGADFLSNALQENEKYRAVATLVSNRMPDLTEAHANRCARSFRRAPSDCPTRAVDAIEIPIPRKQQMRSTVTPKIFATNATVPRGATRHVVKMKVYEYIRIFGSRNRTSWKRNRCLC